MDTTRVSSLRREVSGSAESEAGAIGLGLELAVPFGEAVDQAHESCMTLSDRSDHCGADWPGAGRALCSLADEEEQGWIMDSPIFPQSWQVPELLWHAGGMCVPDLSGAMLGVSGRHQPGGGREAGFPKSLLNLALT